MDESSPLLSPTDKRSSASAARPLSTARFPHHPHAASTPLWRKLFFCYFDGCDCAAPLHERDVWPLEPHFDGVRAAADLSRRLPAHGRLRLLRAICGANASWLGRAAALHVLTFAVGVLRPLLLLYVVNGAAHAGAVDARPVYAPLVALAGVAAVYTLVKCVSYDVSTRIALRVYSALYALVTQRVVAVGTPAAASSGDGSSASSRLGGGGRKQRLVEITKMLASDLDVVCAMVSTALSVLPAVARVAVTVAVLLRVVAVSWFVVGVVLGAYASLLLVELVVGASLGARAEAAFVARLATIHECLKGIQMIKLNAWEDKMERKIEQAWARERVASSRVQAVVAVVRQLIDESPMLLAGLVFASTATRSSSPRAVGEDEHPLTPMRALVTVLLLGDCLRHAGFLKYVVETMHSGLGSWRRVETYLLGGPDVDSEVQAELHSGGGGGGRRRRSSFPSAFTASDANTLMEMKGVCVASSQDVVSSPALLMNVDWAVRQGELTVIHGAAGLGKSLLLSAVRGDTSAVQLVHGTFQPLRSSCRVAYCSQDPWLQTLSIRENILFGTAFEEDKYWAVVDACGLLEDLSVLPGGDATVVGQRGMNLSSGQTARIALARACYADADVYLLDCPLANVDAMVQSEIFSKCIVELLMFKTVIIVTHNPEYIGSTHVDQLVEVQPLSVRVMSRHGSLRKSTRERTSSGSPRVTRRMRDYQQTVTRRLVSDRSLWLSPLSSESRALVERVQSVWARRGHDQGLSEESAVAKAPVAAAKYYIAGGGWKQRVYLVLAVVFSVSWGVMCVARDVCFMKWAEMASSQGVDSEESRSHETATLFWYFVAASFVLELVARAFVFAVNAVAVDGIFTSMTHALLHSSMALFYHTPIGEPLSHYMNDVSMVGRILPGQLGMLLLSVVSFFTRLVVIGWLLGPIGVLVLVVGYALATQILSITFCMQLILLHKRTSTKMLSLMSELVEGETVIRAFGEERASHVFTILEGYNDATKRVLYLAEVHNDSMIVHCDRRSAVLMVALIGVMSTQSLSPAETGLVLLYVFWMQNEIIAHFSTGFVNTWVGMNCVERLRAYTSLPQEPATDPLVGELISIGSSDASDATWPSRGEVVFERVSFEYQGQQTNSVDSALALRDVSFTLRAGEKIGVVGRTGSGKSSLAMALLRVHPLRSGRILIDGVDLRQVPLPVLRRSVTIITQSPTFYHSSIRDYLDPFHEFDDNQLWCELLRVDLGRRVASLDDELLDNGENWSLGQRQLLCFARALLKPSRVIILDESFSCIDQACQGKILEILRDGFSESTVVLITHRLDQILSFDRILVMREGELVESGAAVELAADASSLFFEFLETSLLTF